MTLGRRGDKYLYIQAGDRQLQVKKDKLSECVLEGQTVNPLVVRQGGRRRRRRERQRKKDRLQLTGIVEMVSRNKT